MNTIDPAWAWDAYSPNAKTPWNLQRAGHLYRRAGFSAPWAVLQNTLKIGPEKAVDELLLPGIPSGNYDETTSEFLEKNATRLNSGEEAAGWWLYRMLYGPHPLQEKISLFWHNHFATSYAKVLNVQYMVGQYRLINQHALGKFDQLLQAMSKDPAMMIWLDTVESSKEKPNENYARELMELFSLGIGNYTEKDIREAAKSFTGWKIENDKFSYDEADHDEGQKTVFGKSGNFRGEDIVAMCLAKDACPKFLVRKMFRYLISETMEPEDALLAPLVKQFHDGYNAGRLVETILRSNLFFSENAYRNRIKSPVEYVLGMVRETELTIGTVNPALNLEENLANLGQKVLHPPSVKGWDGGTNWLNGQTLLFRQNFALELARKPRGYRQPANAYALAKSNGINKVEEAVPFFLDLFLQGDVPEETRKEITEYARKAAKKPAPSYWDPAIVQEQNIVSVCHLVLALPEYQLS
ncbi:MAG: DUF1800 domain-containing protein [Zavarzinella sp.]